MVSDQVKAVRFNCVGNLIDPDVAKTITALLLLPLPWNTLGEHE